MRQEWAGKTKSDWSDMNKMIAAAWRNLSEEEKGHYQSIASGIQNRRSTLAGTPLNQAAAEGEDSTAPLSRNQKQRLNQSRLDGALAQVAHHPAWKAGPGLSDHISGLRAELVDMSMAETDDRHGGSSKLEEAVQNFFAYDAKILTNPKLPPFDRACMVLHGGICASSSLFKYVSKLVEEFDSFLACKDKLSSRVLIRCDIKLRQWIPSRASRQIPEQICEPMWFALGCVGRKPKAHVLIDLVSHPYFRLSFRQVNGGPSLQTSHQLFERLLKQHQSLGQPLQHFGLQVLWLSESESPFCQVE